MSSLIVSENLGNVPGVGGAPDQTPLIVLLDPASRLEPQPRDVLQLWTTAVTDKVGGTVGQCFVDSK